MRVRPCLLPERKDTSTARGLYMKISFDPTRLAPAIHCLHRLWFSTMRYENSERLEVLDDLWRAGKPVVLAFWHEEIFSTLGCNYLTEAQYVACISQSKDGEVLSRVVERMGFKTARGSSTRGGVRALLQAKRVMERENRVAVFTVDGPRGPRRQSKEGPIFLAHRAGAAIVPIRVHCSGKYVFSKSWDQFQIPYPFTRCRISMGDPYTIDVPKLDADVMHSERQRLDRTLEAL